MTDHIRKSTRNVDGAPGAVEPLVVPDGSIAGNAGPRIIGGEIDPVGPVNVFNEKLASADAVNRAIDTKTAYDAAHPATPWVPPDRTPIGAPIDPGRPVVFDATKFVIDRAVKGRVTRKRWF
jgi:hypothetical protein